ncbi:MAG TPA: lysylphosphatidylglycerol synthase transmembrane domain-containing protein, partial [Thermoanaerobaculia bacterium]|nr:lysylphosphatidylglycerol synthase transmembrane domain-containing protein [Thermoanaerobaculia bacterium]
MRRRGLLALRAAVSAALIGWLLRRTDFAAVGHAFRAADLRFVVLALLLIPLGYLTSVNRWRLLLRAQGGDAPLSFLLQSLMVGIFFNNLLPSTIGGDAIRAWDTARAGVDRATAVAVVVVDRFVGLLALMLFAAVGLPLSGRIAAHVPELAVWVWAIAAGAGAPRAAGVPPAAPPRQPARQGRRRPLRLPGAGECPAARLRLVARPP